MKTLVLFKLKITWFGQSPVRKLSSVKNLNFYKRANHHMTHGISLLKNKFVKGKGQRRIRMNCLKNLKFKKST